MIILTSPESPPFFLLPSSSQSLADRPASTTLRSHDYSINLGKVELYGKEFRFKNCQRKVAERNDNSTILVSGTYSQKYRVVGNDMHQRRTLLQFHQEREYCSIHGWPLYRY